MIHFSEYFFFFWTIGLISIHRTLMVHFWKGVVFSVLLMPSAFAVLFQVPCYYQTPEETLAMKESAESPSWLLWVSSFTTYCPCLSVTFACPMLQPNKKPSSPQKVQSC